MTPKPPFLVAVACGCALTAACSIRVPFEATVVAAGVDGSKVRTGIFAQRLAYDTLEDGSEVSVELRIDTSNGRPTFNAPDFELTSMEFPMLQGGTADVGHVVFELLDPPPETQKDLAIISWVDVDNDGRLDLSTDGQSEFARTLYTWHEDENVKSYLFYYSFHPGDDPYYTATAYSEANGTNYILGEGQVKGWMTVLTAESEGPPAAEDADDQGVE